MTRYTPPQRKLGSTLDPEDVEAPDSKRWRYLMMFTSAAIFVYVVALFWSTPADEDFAWWAYGLMGALSTIDLFFWWQWRVCLVRDDDAPSEASKVATLFIFCTAVYGFVRAAALLI